MDYEAYVALKLKKAKEQGFKWWYEGKLTDTEANLRVTNKKHHTCVWCKHCKLAKIVGDNKCLLEHNIKDRIVNEITCDEWRYAG